jgi:hypothetical protein
MFSAVLPIEMAGRQANDWQRALQYLAAAWAGLLLLFWRDAADMVAIWWNSSTFNHCLLIVPILVWLVLQRKDLLLELDPQPWLPALLYGAAGAGGWLLGDAAGLAVARQLGLIMMLQGAVAACSFRYFTCSSSCRLAKKQSRRCRC